MAWEPDRRSNFFFSPPAHLCAVTYMTEISLILTLNNQFTHSLTNPHCHLDNRVLCSYFIKTFLFWKYEETDSSFWCQEKLRECLILLVSVFRECILHGSLKHYFIPNFNLFSVKLTAEARIDILRILNTVAEYDISILRECDTLKTVWNQFVDNNCNVSESVQRRNANLIKTDQSLKNRIDSLQDRISRIDRSYLISVIYQVSRCCQKGSTTSLIPFVVQIILLRLYKHVVSNYFINKGNKTTYESCKYIRSNTDGIDISTKQIWYAMLLTTRGDYSLSLRVHQ